MHKWNAVYSSLSVYHVVGKSVDLRVDLGGRRIIKKKKISTGLKNETVLT
jgi:hypothetical protein